MFFHQDFGEIVTLQAVWPPLSYVSYHGDDHTAFTSLRGLREARERGQTSVEGQPHHTPRGPGTLPFPFGERHRAHPHTTGWASLLCLSLYRISGGQSFHRRCPGESLALAWASCFLMPTATAGCSCPWREYAADVVDCVSCSQG